MADGTSDLTKSTLELSIEIPNVGGVQLISLRVTERLSKRTTAIVDVGIHDDIDWSASLLAATTLHVDEVHAATRAKMKSRTWTLKLGQARFVEHKDNAFRYQLELHDSLWPLGLGMSTRKFRNLSADAIVSQLLGEAKVAHRFQLSDALPVRKYTAQYRESNLAFIERLMEFEGIHYRFEEDGTVVFGDETKTAERLREGTPYDLIEAADGMARGDVGLHELRRGKRTGTGRITLGDFNWKIPELKLRETHFGEDDTHLERFFYGAGFRETMQGQRLAKLRTEAYRCESLYLDGKGNDTAFTPGAAFGVDGDAAAAFAGSYLLVSVEHSAKTGQYTEGKEGEDVSSYENRFTSIPVDRTFRPIPETARPTVAGSHTAMVRGPAGEEIHTDKYGRFRAQLHWDREAKGTDEDSRWLRLMQETSSSMVIARTGWEVMVGYIEGDPDRPIGLGRSINGQMTPTYGQPVNKNVMSMKTPSSPASGGFSEIKMDDSAGSQLMHFRAEKDFDGLVKNDKSEKVGVDETHNVGTEMKRQIHGSQFVTIGGNDSADYGDSGELKVGGNRSLKVGGSEKIGIGGTLKTSATKGESEKVGAVRLNVVGSIKMPDFKAMAKQALDGLNPIAAIKEQLKNPFDGLLGKIKEEAKALEDIIKDPKKLLDAPLDKLLGDAKGLQDIIKDPSKLLDTNIISPEAKRLGELVKDPKKLLDAPLGQLVGDAKKLEEMLKDPKKLFDTPLGKALGDAKNLQEILKDPKKLFETPLGKLTEDFKGVQDIIKDPSKLIDTAKASLKDRLQDIGKNIGQDALDKAKEAFKTGGLEGAMKEGWGALEEGVKNALSDLPESARSAVLDGIQAGVGGKVQELMTLGGLIELPEGFKLDGPGGLLPSMDQITQLYGGDAIPQAVQGYLQETIGGKVQDLMSVGGIFKLPEGFELQGPGGVLPSMEQLSQLYGGDAIPTAIQGYLQNTVGGQVTNLLSVGGYIPLPEGFKLEGAGGLLPSVDQLKQLYSIENIRAGLTTKLEGALNTATGDLYDTFLPKGENGQRAFKLGWDQVDKLIDMFTIGGVSKTAEKSIKVMVGGASVKAAIGKIDWGSKIAWLETIGGVKYTRTPAKIDQDVAKHMKVTVLGKTTRGADEALTIHSDGDSSLKVTATAKYDAGTTLEIYGKEELTFDVKSEILFDGAGSTVKMTTGSVTIKGPKVGISASKVIIAGNMLAVTK
jgi:type VI secretion system secreted protein VgrG